MDIAQTPGDLPTPTPPGRGGEPAPVGDPTQTPPAVQEPDVLDPAPVPDAPMIA